MPASGGVSGRKGSGEAVQRLRQDIRDLPHDRDTPEQHAAPAAIRPALDLEALRPELEELLRRRNGRQDAAPGARDAHGSSARLRQAPLATFYMMMPRNDGRGTGADPRHRRAACGQPDGHQECGLKFGIDPTPSRPRPFQLHRLFWPSFNPITIPSRAGPRTGPTAWWSITATGKACPARVQASGFDDRDDPAQSDRGQSDDRPGPGLRSALPQTQAHQDRAGCGELGDHRLLGSGAASTVYRHAGVLGTRLVLMRSAASTRSLEAYRLARESDGGGVPARRRGADAGIPETSFRWRRRRRWSRPRSAAERRDAWPDRVAQVSTRVPPAPMRVPGPVVMSTPCKRLRVLLKIRMIQYSSPYGSRMAIICAMQMMKAIPIISRRSFRFPQIAGLSGGGTDCSVPSSS
jgi:hypothetical protein